MIAACRNALGDVWERVTSRLTASLLDDAPPAQGCRAQSAHVEPPTIKELRSMADRHRLGSLLPFDSWDPETQLYHNRDTIGFVLVGAPATGLSETDLGILRSIFANNHAAGTTIQISVIADPNVEPLLERWETVDGRQSSRDNELFAYMAATRVRYLREAKWRSMFSDQAFLLRSYRLVISYAAPVSRQVLDGSASAEAASADLQRAREALVGTLRSARIHVAPLPPAGLINLLHGMLNPSAKGKARLEYDPLNPIHSQVVDHDTVLLLGPGASSVVHEDVPYSLLTYTAKQFPQAWCGGRNGDLIGSFLSNILRIPCPFWVTMTVRVPDSLASKTKVANKRTRATQMASSPLSKYVTQWHERKRDWDHVAHQMDAGDKLLEAFSQIVLLTPQGEERAAEHALHATYNALGWVLTKTRYAPMHALLASLPMGISQDTNRALELFGLFRTMTGASCANVAPWIAEWTGTPTPTMLLVGRRGQITYFDPFDNDRGNYNLACCAAPGSGKSFFTQEWIFSVLRSGGLAYVIDAGHSYRNLCELFGGTYIDFGDKSRRLCLNPFSAFRADDQAFVSEMMPLLKALLVQMASPDEPLDSMHQSVLERAIWTAWQQRRERATVTTVVEALGAEHGEHGEHVKDDKQKICVDIARRLALMLYPYTADGMYGQYFESESNIDLDNQFVVLDLDELNGVPDLQSVVLRVLMTRITQVMYLRDNKSQKKLCIIDEAWRLLASGNTGKFIEEGYRVARKHGGSFLAISQGISDFFASPAATAAFMCSDHVAYLRQKSEQLAIAESNNYIQDTGGKIDVLRSLETVQGRYSEIALDTQRGMSIVRLIVDPVTEKVYSTKPDEIAFIRREQKRGTPLLQAVEMLVQQSAGR